MKQTDIAAIVLIVAISGVVSFFAAGAVIGSPDKNPVMVEQVTPISANFPVPDKRIFNDSAIDPTVEITGSGESADKPFSN